jgi:hypothetical protein
MKREDSRHNIIALRSIPAGRRAYVLNKWTANRQKRENS